MVPGFVVVVVFAGQQGDSADLPRMFRCQLLKGRGQALELLVPLATKYILSRPENKTRLWSKQQG